MSKQTVALLTFGTALVASVATSPARWDVWDEADGAPFAVDAATPSTSLRIGVDAEAVADAYDSQLTVTLQVTEALGAEGAPLTLDFVLVEETEAGDVEAERIEGWTLEPASDENTVPDVVSLTSWDTNRDGTWRVDVAMTAGTSAAVEWRAFVRIEGDGTEAPEGARVDLVLDPAAP